MRYHLHCKPFLSIACLAILAGVCFMLTLLTSCSGGKGKESETVNGAFAKRPQGEGPNVDRISASGELIIGTISGPDTYFDFHGVGMGLQYLLAEDFARTLGCGVRVELMNDTTALVKALGDGSIDVAALQLPDSYIKRHGSLKAAGAANEAAHSSWAVSREADDLASALADWFTPELTKQLARTERQRVSRIGEVRRHVRAPFISREKSIISTYDSFLKEAAGRIGWDWRLLAAQCYQESGFDPNAVSWAGARGLMQLMPATARQYGLNEQQVYSPRENIFAAASHLSHLQGRFASIADPDERIRFVLAAYNGGYGHVSDAQALARKHGGDPHRWADVGYYVRHLDQPRYYRDPAVRYGYMIGSETAGYVDAIIDRWRQYGGQTAFSPGRPIPTAGGTQHVTAPHRRNRFTRGDVKILSPEELEKAN